MDLKSGLGTVMAAPGKSIDPSKVTERVRDAGFTIAATQATVRGTIGEVAAGRVDLKVPGLPSGLALAGGPQFEALKQRAKPGDTITVTGQVHPEQAHSLAGAPPGLTVDKFQIEGK